MSLGYSQVLRSGLIVMASDRRSITPSASSYHNVQKQFVTRHNIGVTVGGAGMNSFLTGHLPELIATIDVEKYRTPFDVTKYLVEQARNHDPTRNEIVFFVGGHDLAGLKPKPLLYEARTRCTTKISKTWKDGITLVNNGQRIGDIAAGAAYEKFNSEIIAPNINKIINSNLKGVVDFILWAKNRARELHSDPEAISDEMDILAIYHDRHEWIQGR